MKVKSFFLISLFSWFIFISGCRDSNEGATLVFTEEIIYVSGEIVRATGRVIAPGEVDITAHGFEISTNQDFSNPITIDLGNRSVPGRFIGEYLTLSNETDYFLRAFMIIDGKISTGEIYPFSTLGVEIDDFTPKYSYPGQSITITGRNFLDDTRVFFGSKEGDIQKLDFESILTVKSPTPNDGEYLVDLRIVSDGDTLTFGQPYEYAIGKWEEFSLFNNSIQLEKNAYFNYENYFFIGLGEVGISPVSDIWKFDFNTNEWNEVDFTGNSVKYPITFEGGFLGGGIYFDQTGVDISNEFWIVDNNGELIQEGTTPARLYNGIAHKIEDKLYLIGGQNAFRSQMFNIYTYDFSLKSWDFTGTSSIAVTNDYPHFQYDGKIYYLNGEEAIVYSWSPENPDEWQFVSHYPAEIGLGGLAGVVNNKAYFGVFDNNREIHELDLTTGQWKFKSFFPGYDREASVGYFSYDDKVYLMKTANFFGNEMTLWSFDPFDY